MPYTSTTRATLRARLQDRYTGDPFWSTVEANDAINEALRQFNLYTGYWRGASSVQTQPGTPYIGLPTILSAATRVTRDGRVLTRKSIVEFYRHRLGWRSQTTSSGGGVPTTLQEWAPIGLRAIAVWPRDAGGTVLTVSHVITTPVLALDAAFVNIGDEEILLVLDEALWILAFKRPSLQEQMRQKHLAFLAGVLERNDLLRKSAYYRQVLGLDQQQRLIPMRAPNDKAEVGA
jgi:hypothetical protein